MYLALIFIVSMLCSAAVHAQPTAGTFEAGKEPFLLNGEPFVVKTAELLHLPRMESEVPGGIKDFRIYVKKDIFSY